MTGADMSDTLLGGDGSGRTITSFQPGSDRLDLSMMDANKSVAGNQAFCWRGTAAFTGRGQLRIEVVGGDTIVTGHTVGSLAPDFRMLIDGVTGLTQADFIL